MSQDLTPKPKQSKNHLRNRRPSTAPPPLLKPGDLVLHEDDPKTHSMLRRIVEVRRGKARTVFLDEHAQRQHKAKNDAWFPMKSLLDPAIFLQTSEFEATRRKNAAT